MAGIKRREWDILFGGVFFLAGTWTVPQSVTKAKIRGRSIQKETIYESEAEFAMPLRFVIDLYDRPSKKKPSCFPN